MATIRERIKSSGLYKAAFDITTTNPNEEINAEMAKAMAAGIGFSASPSTSPDNWTLNPVNVIFIEEMGRHVIKAGIIAMKNRQGKSKS